jgi:hypothetical protein
MGDTWHGSGPAMEFSLATLKIALNGRNSTFLLPLIGGDFGAVNL